MEIREIIKLLSEDFFLFNDDTSIEAYIEANSINKDSVLKKSLSYVPATKKSINEKQKLLGLKLPPSYVEFLLVSNGFRNISPFLDNLFSIEKIDWAKNLEDQWSLDMFNDESIEVSDEQYFYYEDDQDSVLSRSKYVSESLKISEWYDGMCVFLNPIIKFGEEWEVLEVATWHPGIQRFKSFGEYLLKTHELNQRLLNHRRNNVS